MWFVTIPIAAWITCGTLKFFVNFIRAGSAAIRLIGHGGFPSNHTAIVSSVMWACLLSQRWEMGSLALAVLMIYVFDAMGLRREIGSHAMAINKLTDARCREILGHTPFEVFGGLVLGFAIAASYRASGVIP
jgi:acid phosphatase family membrane protein YuiD